VTVVMSAPLGTVASSDRRPAVPLFYAARESFDMARMGVGPHGRLLTHGRQALQPCKGLH